MLSKECQKPVGMTKSHPPPQKINKNIIVFISRMKESLLFGLPFLFEHRMVFYFQKVLNAFFIFCNAGCHIVNLGNLVQFICKCSLQPYLEKREKGLFKYAVIFLWALSPSSQIVWLLVTNCGFFVKFQSTHYLCHILEFLFYLP